MEKGTRGRDGGFIEEAFLYLSCSNCLALVFYWSGIVIFMQVVGSSRLHKKGCDQSGSPPHLVQRCHAGSCHCPSPDQRGGGADSFTLNKLVTNVSHFVKSNNKPSLFKGADIGAAKVSQLANRKASVLSKNKKANFSFSQGG